MPKRSGFSGITLTEYALCLMLVSGLALGALYMFSGNVHKLFTHNTQQTETGFDALLGLLKSPSGGSSKAAQSPLGSPLDPNGLSPNVSLTSSDTIMTAGTNGNQNLASTVSAPTSVAPTDSLQDTENQNCAESTATQGHMVGDSLATGNAQSVTENVLQFNDTASSCANQAGSGGNDALEETLITETNTINQATAQGVHAAKKGGDIAPAVETIHEASNDICIQGGGTNCTQ